MWSNLFPRAKIVDKAFAHQRIEDRFDPACEPGSLHNVPNKQLVGNQTIAGSTSWITGAGLPERQWFASTHDQSKGIVLGLASVLR